MEPLELAFGVDCPPEHASRCGPSSRRCGGRRATPGEVVAWEPPRRLAYLWHLRQDRADATRVEVTFAPAEAGTEVTIVRSGWERLGAHGSALRERNVHGRRH